MSEIVETKSTWRFVKTRVTSAEHAAFLLALQALGTSASRFLRKVIRGVIGEGPDLLPSELQMLREAVFQVAPAERAHA